MFNDPQGPLTFTGVTGTPFTLNRIPSDGTSTVYATADDTLRLMISHQVTKADRVRSQFEFVHKKIVTNPLDSSNDYDTVTIRLLIDRPSYGWSAADIDALWTGIKTWANTATMLKIYGKEG